MNFENGFVIDIHFDSLAELKKGFSLLAEMLPTKGPIYELNLRLHWQKHTLTTSSLVLCRQFIDELQKQFAELPIYFEFPFCAGEKAQYASFPDCDKCTFFAADWCRWPRQMGRHYMNLQREFFPESFSCLRREDFVGTAPMTWFHPQRQQMRLVALQLQKSEAVFDFGAGNGFVSFLLAEEMTTPRAVYAVDPYVRPAFSHARVQHLQGLPAEMPASWSVLSCLGDYHVPFEQCLNKNTLPRDIIFIRFPDVFGNPGRRTTIEIRQGELVSRKQEGLFDLAWLTAKGYRLILRQPIPSSHYDNTELLIYSRVDAFLNCAEESPPACYPWENKASAKKATTSVCDLL